MNECYFCARARSHFPLCPVLDMSMARYREFFGGRPTPEVKPMEKETPIALPGTEETQPSRNAWLYSAI